jgi:hypothetical protein
MAGRKACATNIMPWCIHVVATLCVAKQIEAGSLLSPRSQTVLAGGKRRTRSEFRVLTRSAGIEIASAKRQESYFLVECRRI